MTLPMRPGWKVVRTDSELDMATVDAALRQAGVRLVLLPKRVSATELALELADADLLLMCYTPITRPLIAGAGQLRAIIKYGVGIDAIDMVAARDHGVPVVNVPTYAEETVAEGAFALLLALAKRMRPIQRAMDTQGWAWPQPAYLAHDLAGKTLGLVGVGRIGRSMARMAGAFRMRVLGYDPLVREWPTAPAIERVDNLGDLLQVCDAVSLHCVLNAETRHLLGAAELARLKPDAWLINVSRGELIDEAALRDALLAGRLGGAALDVYGLEPLAREGHPMSALFGLDNVILWPHLTFFTREASQRLQADTLARCNEAMEGLPLTVVSTDPRLRAQTCGVFFPGSTS